MLYSTSRVSYTRATRAGDVVFVELVAEIVREERRPRKSGELGFLHIGPDRDAQRSVKVASPFHDGLVSDPPHPVEERVLLGDQVVVLLGVVAQPEISEARQPLGPDSSLEPPAIPQERRRELHHCIAAPLGREPDGGVDRRGVRGARLVRRGLPVARPQ